MLGGLFVLSTLYLPKGIVGAVKSIKEGNGKISRLYFFLKEKIASIKGGA
jgi:hypothetical protein